MDRSTHRRMRGPFWSPIRRDWAFWVFIGFWLVDGAYQLTRWNRDAAIGPQLIGLSIQLVFDGLVILALLAIVIGMPRGFRAGWKEARSGTPADSVFSSDDEKTSQT